MLGLVRCGCRARAGTRAAHGGAGAGAHGGAGAGAHGGAGAGAQHEQEQEHASARARFESELRSNYIPTSGLQRALLGGGAALQALLDPQRADLIACLGEVSGELALRGMRARMAATAEGGAVLRERPRVSSRTVRAAALAGMRPGSLGRLYADFMEDNGITADSRLPVRFVRDPELAYVMQRYREVHDLVHAVLSMRTNMLGEVTIKWVEGIQTKLPMCIGGGILGAARLKTKHRHLYLKHYLPWAIKTGVNAKFLQGVYFEKRWDQDIDDFHKEMNITRLVKV